MLEAPRWLKLSLLITYTRFSLKCLKLNDQHIGSNDVIISVFPLYYYLKRHKGRN